LIGMTDETGHPLKRGGRTDGQTPGRRLPPREQEIASMADAEVTIQSLRRLVIDTKDELMHARYRLNGLDLILESLADERAMSASQEIFGLANEKLNVVDDKLDQLYRQLPAPEREGRAV
jgi:hypothetical protein